MVIKFMMLIKLVFNQFRPLRVNITVFQFLNDLHCPSAPDCWDLYRWCTNNFICTQNAMSCSMISKCCFEWFKWYLSQFSRLFLKSYKSHISGRFRFSLYSFLNVMIIFKSGGSVCFLFGSQRSMIIRAYNRISPAK